MRKLLLGTTAVFGAALLAAPAVQAQEAPTVRIGGFVQFDFGYINDNADRQVAGNRPRQTDMRTDGRVNIIAGGKTAAGIAYSATVALDVGANPMNTDRLFVTVASPTLGTVHLGDVRGAATAMQVRAPLPFGFNTAPTFYALRGEVSANASLLRDSFRGIGHANDSTKITYLSPQFAGFDVGVSFSPTAAERTYRGASRSAGGLNQNQLQAALRYRGNFAGVGVAAGFGMVRAERPSGATNVRHPTAYTMGLNASFAGFRLGGEYTFGQYRGRDPGRPGNIAMHLPRGNSSSQQWTIGAGYTFAPVAVTVAYGQSYQDFRDHNVAGVAGRNGRNFRMETIQAGATYNIAPGLVGFALYHYSTTRNQPFLPAGLNGRRTINSFIVGTRLSF